jgi:hypothetical protein
MGDLRMKAKRYFVRRLQLGKGALSRKGSAMCRDVKNRDPAPHRQDQLLPGIAPLVSTLDVSPTNRAILRVCFALHCPLYVSVLGLLPYCAFLRVTREMSRKYHVIMPDRPYM